MTFKRLLFTLCGKTACYIGGSGHILIMHKGGITRPEFERTGMMVNCKICRSRNDLFRFGSSFICKDCLEVIKAYPLLKTQTDTRGL